MICTLERSELNRVNTVALVYKWAMNVPYFYGWFELCFTMKLPGFGKNLFKRRECAIDFQLDLTKEEK